MSRQKANLCVQVGARTHCPQPVCCSPANGKATKASNAASYFGDYHCDLPPWTLDQMVRDIARRHPDVDYVLLTGDFPAHDVWRQSRKANVESAKIVVDVIKKYFPSE